MSKEIKVNYQDFFATCVHQLLRLKDCSVLPEDYIAAGLGRPGNRQDLIDIRKIFKFILDDANKATVVKNFSMGLSTRWKYTESKLKITIIIKQAPSGKIHLTFDYNSKFLAAKTNKILTSGGQSKIKASAELLEGSTEIQPTITSVPLRADAKIDKRLKEKELLKIILQDNPFFSQICYGDEYKNKENNPKISSTALRMNVDLFQLFYPKDAKEVTLVYQKMSKPTLGDILWILFSLIKGISTLHKDGVIHCDLKLENIILTKNQHGHWCLAIADPGLAVLAKDADSYKFRGTIEYAAFDNPIFSQLTQTLVQKKSDIDRFILYVNKLRVGKNRPFQHVTKNDYQDFTSLPILFNHISEAKTINFDKAFLHAKEDVWQVCSLVRAIISWFQRSNFIKKLPTVLQKIDDCMAKNLTAMRHQRDGMNEIEDMLIELLKDVQDGMIIKTFQQQADYYHIKTPIEFKGESKSFGSLSTPLEHVRIEQTRQLILELRHFREELIQQRHKLAGKNFSGVINFFTSELDQQNKELHSLTFVINILEGRTNYRTHPQEPQISTKLRDIFIKNKQIVSEIFSPEFCKLIGLIQESAGKIMSSSA